MTTRYALRPVGPQPCRYGDEHGQEYFRDCPCWLVIDTNQPNDPAAEIYEVAPGQFEVWRDGEMTEAISPETALALMNANNRTRDGEPYGPNGYL